MVAIYEDRPGQLNAGISLITVQWVQVSAHTHVSEREQTSSIQPEDSYLTMNSVDAPAILLTAVVLLVLSPI